MDDGADHDDTSGAPLPARSRPARTRVLIDRSVRIGDLLTSCSILISIIALVLTWSHQIGLQEREQADRIRSAASEMLAKLERWQQISLALFDAVQGEFVATSEFLAEEQDIVAARDRLWRELGTIHQAVLETHLQENMESAYVGIYAFRPRLRTLITSTRADLDAAEQTMFETLLTRTEDSVLGFHGRLEGFESAQLGNDLRARARAIRAEYVDELAQIMMPLSEALLETITADDDGVLQGR